MRKRGATKGGGEAFPIALAYWRKCERCCSTTAPNSSRSPADYCRRERHESTSARFDTNRHPRNGPEPRLYSRTHACACAGAGADQSAGKGARKSWPPAKTRKSVSALSPQVGIVLIWSGFSSVACTLISYGRVVLLLFHVVLSEKGCRRPLPTRECERLVPRRSFR